MFMQGKAMCSVDKKPAGEISTETKAPSYIPPNSGGYDDQNQANNNQQQ